MKYWSLIAILVLSHVASAQESCYSTIQQGRLDPTTTDNFSHYTDERALGDEAAKKCREAFELSVCKSSVASFCPGTPAESITTLGSCRTIAATCGAIPTSVEKRFISKYGMGYRSAQRDVMPMIDKFFWVLKSIQDYKRARSPELPPALARRVPYLSRLAGISLAAAEKKVRDFALRFDAGKMPSVRIDYWGYFQQAVPQRHSTEFRDDKSVARITLAYRYCSGKHRFVNESDSFVGAWLASAVLDDADDRLAGAKWYNRWCAQAPDETGDR